LWERLTAHNHIIIFVMFANQIYALKSTWLVKSIGQIQLIFEGLIPLLYCQINFLSNEEWCENFQVVIIFLTSKCTWQWLSSQITTTNLNFDFNLCSFDNFYIQKNNFSTSVDFIKKIGGKIKLWWPLMCNVFPWNYIHYNIVYINLGFWWKMKVTIKTIFCNLTIEVSLF